MAQLAIRSHFGRRPAQLLNPLPRVDSSGEHVDFRAMKDNTTGSSLETWGVPVAGSSLETRAPPQAKESAKAVTGLDPLAAPAATGPAAVPAAAAAGPQAAVPATPPAPPPRAAIRVQRLPEPSPPPVFPRASFPHHEAALDHVGRSGDRIITCRTCMYTTLAMTYSGGGCPWCGADWAPTGVWALQKTNSCVCDRAWFSSGWSCWCCYTRMEAIRKRWMLRKSWSYAHGSPAGFQLDRRSLLVIPFLPLREDIIVQIMRYIEPPMVLLIQWRSDGEKARQRRKMQSKIKLKMQRRLKTAWRGG